MVVSDGSDENLGEITSVELAIPGNLRLCLLIFTSLSRLVLLAEVCSCGKVCIHHRLNDGICEPSTSFVVICSFGAN